MNRTASAFVRSSVISVILVVGSACSATNTKIMPAEGPFVVPRVQEVSTNEGGGISLVADLGQPVFLVLRLLGEASGGEDIEVGLDGPTISESSYTLLITREREDLGEREFSSPGQSLTIVTLPHNDRKLIAVVPVWFGEAGANGVRGLVFDEPGLYHVRLRFHHVLKQPKYPHERPQWFRLTSQEMFVEVVERDPAVRQFAEAVAPFVVAKDVVSPEGRSILRKHADEAQPPISTWAQWLLLRSYAMDADWWKGLRSGDAKAREQLADVALLAQQFARRGDGFNVRPPRYDALVVLAAKAASEGKADLALKHVAEARQRYGGMMLPREVIGLGEALPSSRAATQPGAAEPQKPGPAGTQAK